MRKQYLRGRGPHFRSSTRSSSINSNRATSSSPCRRPSDSASSRGHHRKNKRCDRDLRIRPPAGLLFPYERCRRGFPVAERYEDEIALQGHRHPLFVQHRHHPGRGCLLAHPEPVKGFLHPGLMSFYWSKMTSWYEEDEEIFVQPVTLFAASTACLRRATSRSSSKGERVADSRRASSCSRPVIRPVTICRSPTPVSTLISGRLPVTLPL